MHSIYVWLILYIAKYTFILLENEEKERVTDENIEGVS